MTDKDKIAIAKVDMLRLSGISKNITRLEENKQALIFALYGTGIDYSKDRVQTTPSNMMEEAFAKVSEIDEKIDRLLDSKQELLEKIYKLNNDSNVNLLIEIYWHNKSYKNVARQMHIGKTTVSDRARQALIEYFNTNCGI